MKKIDLRSDTVTHPTEEMREAMYKAEVGDDVFGDDPTVNKLQEIVASRVGSEDSLFVPSGSMGNLVSLMTHCGRGHEAILGDSSHIFHFEQGGMASLGGIHARTLRNLADGRIDLAEIEGAINVDNVHFARTKLICLENTWNGRVLKPDYQNAVLAIAKKHGLKTHLDGARIFNASVALGIPVKELTKQFDSVQFCFSKGLAAPVGSIVCGSKDFIAEARRNRKLVGGGMRQAGILAAACIVALDRMVERLAEDHENAKRLAEGLAEFPQLEIDLNRVETNIIFFAVRDPTITVEQLCKRLDDEGVLVHSIGGKQIRAVTHYGIEKADIDKTLAVFKQLLVPSAKVRG